MNSVLISKTDIQENGDVLISREQSEHLVNVVKIKIADEIKLTILAEGLCLGSVKEISGKQVTVNIKKKIEVGLQFPISLIIGASRPPTMKKVIEHGSSLGVSKFQILKADLSEKSYLQSKIYQDEQFDRLSKLGIEQSAIFFNMPTCTKAYSRESLEFKDIKQRYILSPYTENKIIETKIDITSPSIFAIGPERGWTHDELSFFKENDFIELSISPSILRVEIATLALLGFLNQKM